MHVYLRLQCHGHQLKCTDTCKVNANKAETIRMFNQFPQPNGACKSLGKKKKYLAASSQKLVYISQRYDFHGSACSSFVNYSYNPHILNYLFRKYWYWMSRMVFYLKFLNTPKMCHKNCNIFRSSKSGLHTANNDRMSSSLKSKPMMKLKEEYKFLCKIGSGAECFSKTRAKLYGVPMFHGLDTCVNCEVSLKV